MKYGSPPGLTPLRHYVPSNREKVKPAPLIPNVGLWYQAADIQHLTRHGVILQEEIQIPGQIRFSFYDPFNDRIEL